MRAAERVPPELSYVLAATTAAEVHDALAWLRGHPISARIEVILAAPAAALARVTATAVPRTVGVAPAPGAARLIDVRLAGARATTGALVVVIDCNEPLDGRVKDPFVDGAGYEEPGLWRVDDHEVGTLPSVAAEPLPR